MILFAIILGLIIGSFLNVIIYRWPLMMQRQWRAECQEYLQVATDSKNETFNIALPASHCPQCKMPLKWWHNVPLLSYLLLRGRCAHCAHKISWQYPCVEMLTAIMSAIVIMHFGLTWICIPALVFSWGLIVLSCIDIQHHLIPDELSYCLLWLGLAVSTQTYFVASPNAIMGALVGYLFLWVVASLYKLARKKIGMGHGDFKLLALIGAWFGVQLVLPLLILAIAIALLVSLIAILSRKLNVQQRIPFGPFLAIAAFIGLILFTPLTHFSTKLFGG